MQTNKKEKVAWKWTVFFHKGLKKQLTPVFNKLPAIEITFLYAASAIKKKPNLFFFYSKARDDFRYNIKMEKRSFEERRPVTIQIYQLSDNKKREKYIWQVRQKQKVILSKRSISQT